MVGGNKMVSCQKWELKRLFVFSDSWKKATLDFLSIEQKSDFFYGGKDEILQRSVAAEQF